MVLTEEEWLEMNALRMAITENPAAVHPDRQERFTALLVKSWPAQGDSPPTDPLPLT